MSSIVSTAKNITSELAPTLSAVIFAPCKLLDSNSGMAALGMVAVSLGIGYYLKKRLQLIGKDEQLYLETATELQVINGPKIHLMPLIMKSAQVKKATTLSKLQYCVVVNELTGNKRVEEGPQLQICLLYTSPSPRD